MSIREYWAGVWAGIKKSWTMHSATLFVVLGVLELQLSLIKPYIGEKGYAYTAIAVACIMAVARFKGISKDVKAGK
jgi:hypothetical protein